MWRDSIVTHRRYLIITFLVACMGIAFWLRTIPAAAFSYPDYMGLASPDIWYNFRQIEVMIHHFPEYAWFDPMTAFPTGKNVDWGPFFTFLSAGLVLLLGSSGRPELMESASFIGPLIGVILIPVVYLLGRLIWDTWAGIFAALFITVGSYTLFFRTSYGYVDHHGLEALLSTAFILTYLGALIYTKSNPVARNTPDSFIKPLLFATLAGVVFVLGLLNMPTMILFAFIVAIFSLFAFILHAFSKSSSDYLLFTNIITFIVVLIGLLLIGIKSPGMAISQYSWGQFACYILLIIASFILWGLGKFQKNITIYLIAIIMACVALIALLVFSGSNIITESLGLFFGHQFESPIIGEMLGSTIDFALFSYNFGLILAGAGLAILIWKSLCTRELRLIFLLVWSAIIILSTIQHNRYEYYFAINFAILSGITVSWAFSLSGRDLLSYFEKKAGDLFRSPEESPGREKKSEIDVSKKRKSVSKKRKIRQGGRSDFISTLKILLILIFLVISALFIVFSVNNDLKYAGDPTPHMMDPDWIGELLWLKTSSPTTGVDSLKVYEKDTFEYPKEAYGVMAWWDYGHYISFIGERIPNTNPFQDHLAGKNGAAAFFTAQDEPSAAKNIEKAGSKFIITNVEIATSKFYAIAEWRNASSGVEPYQKQFLFPDRERLNQYIPVFFNTAEYYRTIIARLHLYDGTAVHPTTAFYVEYEERPKFSLPVVMVSKDLPVDTARENVDRFNMHANPGTGALILSSQVMSPLEELPALQHFRLVHESSANSSKIFGGQAASNLKNIPHIKVFEYVKGARIPGEGTIEVYIVTNTGREFIYQQKSKKGEFIVPYATTGSTWDVRTKGSYRILETNRSVDVTDQDVREGRTLIE